jgi:hypothetical protein
MDPITTLLSFLGFILGLMLLIIFILMASNVGKISRYIEDIYTFERARMIRDGLMSEAGKLYPPKSPTPPSSAS